MKIQNQKNLNQNRVKKFKKTIYKKKTLNLQLEKIKKMEIPKIIIMMILSNKKILTSKLKKLTSKKMKGQIQDQIIQILQKSNKINQKLLVQK